jgi:hypothetical protein
MKKMDWHNLLNRVMCWIHMVAESLKQFIKELSEPHVAVTLSEIDEVYV